VARAEGAEQYRYEGVGDGDGFEDETTDVALQTLKPKHEEETQVLYVIAEGDEDEERGDGG